MKNKSIKLHSVINTNKPTFVISKTQSIVSKWTTIQMAVFFAAYLAATIVVSINDSMTGMRIGYMIISVIPLASYMVVINRMEREAVRFVNSRIPSDISFASNQELFIELGSRSKGCFGVFLDDKKAPLLWERFENKEDQRRAAEFSMFWAEAVTK